MNTQVKIYGYKGIPHDSMCHTNASIIRFFFSFFFFLVDFILFWGKVARVESGYEETGKQMGSRCVM